MNFKKPYFIAINTFFIATFLSFVFYAVHFEKPMFTHFDGITVRGLWQFNLPVVDEHGNYLYTDGDLNMAILIHANMSKNESHDIIDNYLPMWIAPRKSVIFKETNNEIVVDARENSLIVVNNSSGEKAIIPLNFNLHKEHHLKLYKQYHNSKVDTSIYNLFQDIIDDPAGLRGRNQRSVFKRQGWQTRTSMKPFTWELGGAIGFFAPTGQLQAEPKETPRGLKQPRQYFSGAL